MAIAALFLAALAGSALPSLWAIWKPTNEDREEVLIRQAVKQLPKGPIDLVRLDYSDQLEGVSGSQVHLHFPDYLYKSAKERRRVWSLKEWSASGGSDAPAYFFLGIRCYTPEKPFASPSFRPMLLRPACKRMLKEYGSRPLFESKVKNRGDLWAMGYYSSDRSISLKLGLYKLRRKGGQPAPARGRREK